MNRQTLTVVLPVYNEASAIRRTLESWLDALEELGIDFQLCAYDDGSTDRTGEVLDTLAESNARLRIIHQANAGHGPTILRAYREATGDWIFQADSDGEIGPEALATLWRQRHDFDFLVGFRQGRQASFARQLMTAGARWAVRLGFGKTIRDVNIPYRLMRRDRLMPLLAHLPPETFAPNVALSGLAAATGLRVYESPVKSRPRAGGETSLQRLKLLQAAYRSLVETVGVAWRFRSRSFRGQAYRQS
ncbi:MAG: glycosyltransferase family 2 protein [Acidobacteriota bacterium]